MSLKIRFVAGVATLFGAALLASSLGSINAQGPAYNYGVFDHAKHDAALTTTGQQQISCDVCHKREAGTEQLFYPGHDACIQCHVPQFTTQTFEICAVCHKDVKAQGRALLDFPAERTDYGVIFDGAGGKSQHVVHMNEALPDGKKMTCNFCHKSQGVNQAFPSHPECYVCHTPGANSKAASAQLASCDACHKAPGTPNTEMRRLISTRRNDALPYRFRHGDHVRAAGCMECHRTEGAVHVLSTATREHRTRANFTCYECHRGGGKSRITETSCGSCHGVMVF
jgi:hypothetical protein